MSRIESNAASYLQQAKDTIQDAAGQAGQVVSDQYQQLQDQAEAGYEQAREFVDQRPMQSLGLAFMAGAIAGALLTVTLSSHEECSYTGRRK